MSVREWIGRSLILVACGPALLAQTPSTNVAVRAIDVSVSPTSPVKNSPMTYMITVRNLSSNQANNVTLMDILPGTIMSVSGSAPGGSCNVNCAGMGSPVVVTCSMGNLTAAATAAATITLTPTVTGTQTSVLSVAANEYDTNLSDNAISDNRTINSAPAPAISGLSRSSGTTSGGDSVIISGSNFVSGATAKFGTTAATVVSYNVPTQITVTTPGHAAGPVAVTVTNPDLQTSAPFNSFTYQCPAISVSPSSLPQGTATVAYNQSLTASPLAPYVFSVISGTLPGGLTLSSGGVLSGTPSSPGTFSFTVRAMDAQGCTGSRSYSLVVLAAPSRFYAMVPCRVLDTRNATGPYGAPALSGSVARSFTIAGQCGVPAGTTAIVANFTVVNATSQGSLVAYPAAVPVPLAGIVSYSGTLPIASLATILLDSNGAIGVYPYQASGTTVDLILDISGYYK